jgi:hypothetical protein
MAGGILFKFSSIFLIATAMEKATHRKIEFVLCELFEARF